MKLKLNWTKCDCKNAAAKKKATNGGKNQKVDLKKKSREEGKNKQTNGGGGPENENVHLLNGSAKRRKKTKKMGRKGERESGRHTILMALEPEIASSSSLEECVALLRTDPINGLSQAESVRRLDICGHNEFQMKKRELVIVKYLRQFKNPLICLLLVSALISAMLGQYNDALSITIAVLIVVTVGFIQEYRSEKTLEKLDKLVPPMAHCIRDGKGHQFNARQLVPGDVVLLSTGDRVPADLRITESIQLQIDESSFTGENEAKYKHSNAIGDGHKLSAEDGGHFDNIAFMGTLICSGRGQGIVIATGEESKFGEVFRLIQSEKSPKTPLQRSMDKLGKQLSLYSFAIIALIFGIGLVQRRPILDMFTIGVSLAVAAIPEGLPIVVAVTLAIGVMRMGRRNAVVKKLAAVETLGCVTVICCDKTGTLTKNEMTASIIMAADGTKAEVTGIGYDPSDGQCHYPANGPNSRSAIDRVVEIGAVCNNSQWVNGKLAGQPTEKALQVLAMKAKMEHFRHNFVRLCETPFTSENKWMAVQVEGPDKKKWTMVKGAIDRILPMCIGYLEEGQTQRPMTPEGIGQIQQLASGLAKSGLRVIAMASGDGMDSLYYVGFVGIMDPPRPGCRESIETVQCSGVAVKMVTGDAEDTAKSIGSLLHIYQPGDACLSGVQLDGLTEPNLERIIRNVSIFYRTSPSHKVGFRMTIFQYRFWFLLRIVKALQNVGEVVAMTGDGVNDAVALKKADIGVAMGESGTDVCKEAADMVLLNDDFSTIRAAIEEGKGIYHNILNFVKFQLSTSVAALSLIAISTIFHFDNPLNAIQILWINIIMDGPPAQSLGVERVDADIVKQPPRNVHEPLLNKSLLFAIASSATIMLAGTLFVFYDEMTADYKVTTRDTTMTFTCFILFGMWNSISCRSSRKMIWQIGIFSNPFFLVAISLTLICQMLVIFLPPLQPMFKTEALTFYDLLFLTLLTSSVFVFNESAKFVRLQMEKRKMKKGKNKEERDGKNSGDGEMDGLVHVSCCKT